MTTKLRRFAKLSKTFLAARQFTDLQVKQKPAQLNRLALKTLNWRRRNASTTWDWRRILLIKSSLLWRISSLNFTRISWAENSLICQRKLTILLLFPGGLTSAWWCCRIHVTRNNFPWKLSRKCRRFRLKLSTKCRATRRKITISAAPDSPSQHPLRWATSLT